MADKNALDGFTDEFDDEFAVGNEDGNRAFVGLNVLRGLIEGVDDFIHLRQDRWRPFRSLGPVMLGSAMWIDDQELIGKIGELSGACIVVSKQKRGDPKLEPLRVLNEHSPGMPVHAFANLTGLAPKVDGKALIVGPSGPMETSMVPTVRTIGYRRSDKFVPIIHAKLALLGHMWWHDEGPSGEVEDVIGFTPRRLWISSANFTRASRHSLEFGYWTEDANLVHGAQRFLVALMGASEELDPTTDAFEPELAPVEFDDAAMAEAWAYMELAEGEEEA